MPEIAPFPPAPPGYDACRVIMSNAMMTHLVELDEKGSNGGRPTACGLSRFDRYTEDGSGLVKTADLPGWGMGDSGVRGPGVTQHRCVHCYAIAEG